MKWFILLLPSVVIYLAGAFVAWQWDPSMWESFGRFCAVSLDVIATFLVCAR